MFPKWQSLYTDSLLACGGAAIWFESRLEFGQCLHGSSWPDPVVLGDDYGPLLAVLIHKSCGDRRNLLLERASLLRLAGSLTQ